MGMSVGRPGPGLPATVQEFLNGTITDLNSKLCKVNTSRHTQPHSYGTALEFRCPAHKNWLCTELTLFSRINGVINQEPDKRPADNSQLIIVSFICLCSWIEILCNAQSKSVSAKFIVDIGNQDPLTQLGINVNFCSREYGNDGVIIGQYKMKGCQSNSLASARADTEIFKILFIEGKSRSFADCNLQRYGLV